jgi:hypothetical protein
MSEDILRIPQIDDDDLVKAMIDTITDLQERVAQLEAAPADDLEIKATTGDFATADSWNGRRVLNTFDNNYKILAEGAWRQILAY